MWEKYIYMECEGLGSCKNYSECGINEHETKKNGGLLILQIDRYVSVFSRWYPKIQRINPRQREKWTKGEKKSEELKDVDRPITT